MIHRSPQSRRRLAALATILTGVALALAPVAAADGALLTGGPTGPTNDDTPSFTWSASGAATCALDGADPAPCTSPFTASELADGPHVFEVRVADEVDARSFVLDTVAPTLRMGGADATHTEPVATFTFTAEAGAETACAIDSGSFEPCTSPYATPALRNGTHAVHVRATDGAGNETATSRIARMEVEAPDTAIAAGPGDFTDEARPTFSFTATRPGSRFLCTLDDAAAVPCGASWAPETALAVGPHTLSVRAVDAAGNADASPAERRFTVAQCERSVRIGAVDIAADCLRNTGGQLEASGPVKVNGITFNPKGKAGAATIAIDQADRKVVIRDVQLRMGAIVLYQGDLEFTVPAEDTFTLATIDLETKTRSDAPAGDSEAALDLAGDDDAQAAGFPLKGQAKLELSKGAAILTANIELPAVFTDAEGNGLTGMVKISSDNARGVRLDQARVTAPLAFIGKLELQNLSVAFIGDGSGAAGPTCNTPSPGLRWEGSASVIVLPTPDRTQLTDVGVGFADGTLSHAEATWLPGSDGASLGGGVKLTKLSVGLCAGPPVKLTGRAGLTAMPGADGKPRLLVPDAGLIYTGGTDGGPWTIRAEAPEATLAGDIPFAFRDLFVQVSSAGSVEFGGGVRFSVPLKGAAGPVSLDAAVTVDASAKGFIEGSTFNVDLQATGCFTGTFSVESLPSVPFSDVCPGIEGVVSSTGFAVCGSLKVGSRDIGRIGAGKRWDGALNFMSGACDVGPWRVARPAATGATAARLSAPGTRRFTVPGGRRGVLVALRGADGPPQVTLRGPGGQSITTPADASGSTRTDRALAFANVAAKTTYVALRAPQGGTWTASPVAPTGHSSSPGEAPSQHEAGASDRSSIADVTAAELLPPPRVRGTVAGRGRERTLRFVASSRAGQTIRFVERGRGVARTVKVLRTGGNGRAAFRPAPGPAGKRTIEALVEQDGVPRERITVATYSAPGPQRPGRPAQVAVARHAKGLAITWSPAVRATRYAIRVQLDDGRALFFVRPRTSRALIVPGVPRSVGVAARVVGLRRDNTAGPAGTARSAASEAKAKAKPAQTESGSRR